MHSSAPQHLNLQKPTRLALYRHAYGMTAQALAEASGVPRSTIANYESRAHLPSPEAAGRLAAALGLPVSEVFSDEEDDES